MLAASTLASIMPGLMLMGCPLEFNANLIPGMCAAQFGEPSSWFSAEASCRQRGAHLLRVVRETQVTNANLATKTWVGLSAVSGAWKWSDNMPVDSIEDEWMLPALKKDARCASVHTLDGNSFLESVTCHTKLPYICAMGMEGCVWQRRDLAFYGGFPTGETHILPTNVMLSNGKEIGLGKWITPNTFSVEDLFGTGRCNYLAVFTKDSITTGCQNGTMIGVIADPKKAMWRTQPDCNSPPKEASDSFTRLGTPEPTKPFVDGPPPLTPPPGKKPGVDTDPQPEEKTTIKAKEQVRTSNVPTWVWPAALVTAVLVSAVAAIGAANRRGRRKGSNNGSSSRSSGSTEMTKIGEHDEDEENGTKPLAAPACVPEQLCEACQKFSQTRARQRLLNVHRNLAAELALPLVIRSITCVHQPKEHVHLFEVENEFSNHTLQSLSTLYSRTKPRPRATRIHIEPKATVMETTFEGEGYM
eukprot:TRINITY_DN1390_c4_g1_i1.p1 TRINITY_DN1390_c4_g1~~TRINITY_DN1390_c4_g1_i1.p1  ORF type:complete len:495 (+),score=91.95 TRINITY_DN1390_c4_g1_i1:70-1485(+)